MAISDNIVDVIGKWLKGVSLTEETYAYLIKKKGDGPQKKPTLDREIQELLEKRLSHFEKGLAIIRTYLVYLGKESGIEENNELATRMFLIGINLLTVFEQPYSISPFDMLTGLFIYMKSVRASLLGKYNSPVVSIANLSLRQDIIRALFYYNGIATIGDLEFTIKNGGKLLSIGPVKKEACQQAIENWKLAAQNGTFWIQLSENEQIVPVGNGLWKRSRDQGGGIYYIEMNSAQAVLLKDRIPIAFLKDGTALARLEFI